MSERFGRFELGAIRSEGPAGRLHEARDPEEPERRLLLLEFPTDGSDAQSYGHEVLTVARVLIGRYRAGSVHNLVEVIREDGRSGLALLDTSRTLDALLREAPCPPGQVADLLGDILDALAAIQEIKGALRWPLVHGGIAPGNLYLAQGADGRERALLGVPGPALASTGLARRILPIQRYASPERHRGIREKIDVRSDIYAAGQVAAELILGPGEFERLACRSGKGMETEDWHRYHVNPAHNLPDLCSVDPRFPQTFSSYLLKLLCKPPDRRPGDAKLAVQELRSLGSLQSAPRIDLRPPPAAEPPPPPPPRSRFPRRAAFVAGGCVLLALALAAGLWFSRGETGPRQVLMPTLAPGNEGPPAVLAAVLDDLKSASAEAVQFRSPGQDDTADLTFAQGDEPVDAFRQALERHGIEAAVVLGQPEEGFEETSGEADEATQQRHRRNVPTFELTWNDAKGGQDLPLSARLAGEEVIEAVVVKRVRKLRAFVRIPCGLFVAKAPEDAPPFVPETVEGSSEYEWLEWSLEGPPDAVEPQALWTVCLSRTPEVPRDRLLADARSEAVARAANAIRKALDLPRTREASGKREAAGAPPALPPPVDALGMSLRPALESGERNRLLSALGNLEEAAAALRARNAAGDASEYAVTLARGYGTLALALDPVDPATARSAGDLADRLWSLAVRVQASEPGIAAEAALWSAARATPKDALARAGAAAAGQDSDASHWIAAALAMVLDADRGGDAGAVLRHCDALAAWLTRARRGELGRWMAGKGADGAERPLTALVRGAAVAAALGKPERGAAARAPAGFVLGICDTIRGEALDRPELVEEGLARLRKLMEPAAYSSIFYPAHLAAGDALFVSGREQEGRTAWYSYRDVGGDPVVWAERLRWARR